MKILTIIGMLALSIATSSQAQGIETNESESIEDPSMCKFSASWEGLEDRSPTLMFVQENQAQFDNGDEVIVFFYNEDWSISPGDQIGEIKVQNENGAWFSNEGFAGENSFIIPSRFDHIENVFGSSATSMVVTRNGKTIDRLSMGIILEWYNFRRCHSKKVEVIQDRERKERLKREIPKDPFSN